MIIQIPKLTWSTFYRYNKFKKIPKPDWSKLILKSWWNYNFYTIFYTIFGHVNALNNPRVNFGNYKAIVLKI